MRPLARWCVKHRLVVLAAWLGILVALVFAQSVMGSNYASGTAPAGTESAQAAALLAKAAPSVSGDTEHIVFAVQQGSVRDAAVQARIDTMLRQVATLNNVTTVTSPYGPGAAQQISANDKVAFATVDFSVPDTKVSATDAQHFVDVAKSAGSSTLQVDVLGSVAASTNPTSQTGNLVGVGAALVVLLIVFGSLLAAVLPLVVTGISLVAALSLIGVLSNSLSMAGFTSQLCTLIGLGVGVDYALFLLTRIRSGMRRGLSTEEAIVAAAGTAGRAVFFAGITVCIALLGMVTVGVGVLTGAAVAASLAVLFTMIAAQTLLPALVGIFGTRVLTRRQRRELRAGNLTSEESSKWWRSWASFVQHHRVGAGAAAVAVMLTLGAPFLSMRLGSADYGTDPTTTTTTTYRAYQLLAQGFGPGFSGPLQLVAPVSTAADQAAFTTVVSASGRAPGVAAVTPPQFLPPGPGHSGVGVASVYPTGSPQDQSTSDLLTKLRTGVIPTATANTHLTVYVGGQTAMAADEATQLSSTLPLFVGIVVALSFLLLMVVFRSLVIPAKAALMNLLSAAAAFGVIVAVFQWGWLGNVFGVPRSGPIAPLVPILMFAVLFGLSMDYEVFLISRMHEEWLKHRDNARAVNVGLAATGRVITAAAGIMVVVFASFTLTTDRTIKLIGLGMAVAIALDALVVRTLLVPALMHTFGRANWYLPQWLDRRLPHITLDSDHDTAIVDRRVEERAEAGRKATLPAPTPTPVK
jgi:RND superfamily putative drug exporter